MGPIMSFTNFCYFLFLRTKYSPQHSTPTPHALNLRSYLKMCPDLGRCVRNTNQNTAVSIVIRLRAGQSRDWFPTGKRVFSSPKNVQTGSPVQPASYSTGDLNFVPGGYAAGALSW